MAYINNYGFSLGDRTSVIGNFDRGQSPQFYYSLSDTSQVGEGLGRFNFDSVDFSDQVMGQTVCCDSSTTTSSPPGWGEGSLTI